MTRLFLYRGYPRTLNEIINLNEGNIRAKITINKAREIESIELNNVFK
ncbi:hypothetical protein [uncultured Clostridium sp.]|nr:hypothetical protein [uncultured Clostridium sp.]